LKGESRLLIRDLDQGGELSPGWRLEKSRTDQIGGG